MEDAKTTQIDIGACTFEEETEIFQEVWKELENWIKQDTFNKPIEKELLGLIEKKDMYGLTILWNLYGDSCKEYSDYENQSDKVKEFLEKLHFPVR